MSGILKDNIVLPTCCVASILSVEDLNNLFARIFRLVVVNVVTGAPIESLAFDGV